MTWRQAIDEWSFFSDLPNTCICLLDYLLYLLVVPVSGVLFWITLSILVSKTDGGFKMSINLGCVFIYILMHLASNSIYRFIRPYARPSTVNFFILSKIYIYVCALCGTIINVSLFEEEILSSMPGSENLLISATLMVFSFIVLLAIKCRPHLATMSMGGGGDDIGKEDTIEDVFLFPFRLFNYSWKRNKCLYVLDSIFSVFLVSTLVILVWRGAWFLLDETIFPDKTELSGWISLVIGYSVAFVTLVLQSLTQTLVKKYRGWRRLVMLDMYIVVSFCGTINIWRGIWILLITYLPLDSSLGHCVLLHFFSFFVLVLFNASTTLLVRGVYIDDENENGGDDCLEFPCYYFRLRFQDWQEKKQNKKNALFELNALNTTTSLMNTNATIYKDDGDGIDVNNAHIDVDVNGSCGYIGTKDDTANNNEYE